MGKKSSDRYQENETQNINELRDGLLIRHP